MIITTITLWLCVVINLACIAVNAYDFCKRRKDYEEATEAKRRADKVIAEFIAVCLDEQPKYRIEKADSKPYWAVVRQSTLVKGGAECVIKSFKDDDEEFNKRQAEELAELLNA